jgi:oxygen-dependent protoporphyrinogen oxidase
MPRIGVLGAGISGLTAAHRLHRSGVDVQVLEATDRPGGVIRSDRREGYLVECGPNTVQSTPLLDELVRDLDLTSERVWADDAASRRYIVRDGEPLPLPTSLGAFFTTDLLSGRAKARLLAEPFIGRRTHDSEEESLANFTRRRLGPEVLDYAVAPFVGGVFAGDPEQLSTRHTFEQLVRWEQEYGSLIWGALRSGGSDAENDAPTGLFSFRQGLEALPRALADDLGDRMLYNTSVSRIRKEEEQWTVHLDDSVDPDHFDALISTIPLHKLGDIEVDSSVDLTPLDEVSYSPVRVVALGYERSAVKHPLDGFGVLVPPIEDFDVLGTLFSSTLFSDRAPEDHVLLTTFVGGARNPQRAQRPASMVQSIVEDNLEQLLGAHGPPTFSRQTFWSNAIPQYTLGYTRVKDTLNTLEAEHNGLYFAGNYREGVSVGDAAASGAAAADRCMETLKVAESAD